MEGKKGFGDYLAFLQEKRPDFPEDLRVTLPDGTDTSKSAREVLKEFSPEDSKRIEEDLMDLEAAFKRSWSTLDPPGTLACWAKDLEDEGASVWNLQQVAILADSGAVGQAEASRVLYHLFKQGAVIRDVNKYLHTAISHSQTFIRTDMHLYESPMPDPGRGPQGYGRWRDYRGPQERPRPRYFPAPPPRGPQVIVTYNDPRSGDIRFKTSSSSGGPPAPAGPPPPSQGGEGNPWSRWTPLSQGRPQGDGGACQ